MTELDAWRGLENDASSKIRINTMSEAKPEVLIAPIWRGWAVLSRASWDHINAQLDTIAAIASCKTWGAYRRLEVDDDGFQELVYQETDVELGEEPTDEVSFDVDLSQYEDYDRDPWLQRATTDFFEAVLPESLGDDSFPWVLVDSIDIRTTVEDENISAIVEALEQRGFQVTTMAE